MGSRTSPSPGDGFSHAPGVGKQGKKHLTLLVFQYLGREILGELAFHRRHRQQKYSVHHLPRNSSLALLAVVCVQSLVGLHQFVVSDIFHRFHSVSPLAEEPAFLILRPAGAARRTALFCKALYNILRISARKAVHLP